ncbi:MAG: hypothetical protein CMI63_10815 [Parvularcula sp.]|nr:hypothetical protein [Parvularcula sp.]
MWKQRVVIDEERGHKGTMGWVVETRDGARMIRHFGGDDGFRSALILLPDTRQAMLFVTNDEDANLRAYLLPALEMLKERSSASSK